MARIANALTGRVITIAAQHHPAAKCQDRTLTSFAGALAWIEQADVEEPCVRWLFQIGCPVEAHRICRTPRMNDKCGFQVAEVAPRYYESHVERFMTPFVDSLVAAAVNHGDAVLDLACGTGFAARAASVATGPTGRVVGSDINSDMLAMAQSVPHANGCEISWQQASALELPFNNAEFDTVVCQQGIQFFPDTAAGLQEMARVIKPGGCLAVTAWAVREESPYLDATFGMLSDRCDGDLAANAKVFVRGGEAQLRGWFEMAGLGPVSIETIEALVALPTIAEYVPDHISALPPSSAGNFFDLSDDAQGELLRALEDQLGDYRTDRGLEIPFRSYLAKTVIRDRY